ncbi:MAG: hypothetical protein AAF222_07475 [Pseudomonadota bacterium]
MSEDSGLFRSEVIDISLTLLPFNKRSSRGDLIYIGMINGAEVEVVFAGRRMSAIGPLKRAIAQGTHGTQKTVGFALNAKGVWRTRLVPRDDLDVQRVYQFVVAEWTVPNEKGGATTFGEPPLKD